MELGAPPSSRPDFRSAAHSFSLSSLVSISLPFTTARCAVRVRVLEPRFRVILDHGRFRLICPLALLLSRRPCFYRVASSGFRSTVELTRHAPNMGFKMCSEDRRLPPLSPLSLSLSLTHTLSLSLSCSLSLSVVVMVPDSSPCCTLSD